jgi:hypothetical protein
MTAAARQGRAWVATLDLGNLNRQNQQGDDDGKNPVAERLDSPRGHLSNAEQST